MFSAIGWLLTQIAYYLSYGLTAAIRFEAICKLVEGMPVEEVTKRLRGIVCQNGTSCPDQLVTALEEAMSNK